MDFLKGEIDGVHVRNLTKFVDDRGYLMETFRLDELPAGLQPVMSYVSSTEPGVARGPHEHRDQTDIFAFAGPGNFKVALWDNRSSSSTPHHRMILFAGQDNPVSIVIPPGVVHAYRNISRTSVEWVLNFPNQLYAGRGKTDAVDEIRHEDQHDDFYRDFVE